MAQTRERGTDHKDPLKGDTTPGARLLLEVDVGTDQHVIEQEDPAFLGLDQLPTVSVHCLRQSLTEKQLPLARGQQLEKGRNREGGQCQCHDPERCTDRQARGSEPLPPFRKEDPVTPALGG